MYGNQATNKCTKCDQGLIPNQNKDGCIPCSKNHYEPEPTNGQCDKCPKGKVTANEGHYKNASCVSCNWGDNKYQAKQGEDCQVCPASLIVTHQTATNAGLDRCTCPDGHELNDASDQTKGCTSCKPGTAFDAALQNCTACSPGFFQDNAGHMLCKPCARNQFQLASGQAACVNCDETCSTCQPGEPTTCTACATVPRKLNLDTAKNTCNVDCPNGYEALNRVCIEIVDVHAPEFNCDLSCPTDQTEHAWSPAKEAHVWWVPPAIQDAHSMADVSVTVDAFLDQVPVEFRTVQVLVDTAPDGSTSDDVLVEFLLNGNWSAPTVLANGASTDVQSSKTFADLTAVPTKIRLSTADVNGWSSSKVQVLMDGQDLLLANKDFTTQAYVLKNIVPRSGTEVSPGDAFAVGNHTILYTATDAAGNYQHYQFTITVLEGDRSNCPSSARGDQQRHARSLKTKQRREEERVHERRKRYGFDHRKDYVVNHATGARLQVHSVGEHAEDMVSLIDDPAVMSVECAPHSITLVMARSTVNDWSKGALFAVDQAFGCRDKVSGKIDSVYRRAIDSGTILKSSEERAEADGQQFAIRFATSDASLVDCFRHAEVRYDYDPGVRPPMQPVNPFGSKNESQKSTTDFGSSSTTQSVGHDARSAVARERHRRGVIDKYFPWIIDDECFLGYCMNMGMNYNDKTDSATEHEIVFARSGPADDPTLNVACIECFAMIHIGLHFYLRIDGSDGDGVKLSKLSLSVVGDAHAELDFQALANYNEIYPPATKFFDQEFLTVGIKIPIGIGTIVMGAEASVQLFSKYEINVRGTAELRVTAGFQRRIEQGIQYVNGEGWGRINPKPISKMEFAVEKFTIPEAITAKLYPVMPQIRLKLTGGLSFAGGVIKGIVGIDGLIFRIKPYIQLGYEITKVCEPSVAVHYGLDWEAWVEMYFAEATIDIWIKKWTKRFDVAGHPLGSGTILKETKLFDYCRKRMYADWRIGSWGACTGTRVRVVECRDQDGKVVLGGRCPRPVPASSDPCEFDCRASAASCNEHGLCQQSSGKCSCKTGWNGDESCLTHSCDHAVCGAYPNVDSNNACQSPNQCACTAGFTGPTCSQKQCTEGEDCGNGEGCVGDCDCDDGWRRDSKSGKCTVAHYKCIDRPTGCRWCGQGEETCLECNEGFTLESSTCKGNPKECQPPTPFSYQGGCKEKCPTWTVGLQKDGKTICEDCDSTCKTCNGPEENKCTSCRASKYLSEDASNGTFCCNPGFFGAIGSTANGCRDNRCSLNCKHCTSATVCTQCDSPFVLSSGTCAASCDAGFFLDSNSASDQIAKCSTCQASCLSCAGSSAKDCTSCAADKFLTKGECVLEKDCPANTAAFNRKCIEPFAPEGQPERFCDPFACPESYRGDGECDDACNIELCGNDRGDCNLGGNAAHCNSLVSCSSCQSASECGWCPGNQMCQNYTYDSGSIVDTCTQELMTTGCLLRPYEDPIEFIGTLADAGGAAETPAEWTGGEELTIEWEGGKVGGEVILEFRVEGGNWIDGNVMLADGATNPLPNTGGAQLKLPAQMPATCALEFQLTSESKEINRAYTRDIVVKASARRHGRGLDAAPVAWSPDAWGECSSQCGGGSRTRNMTCVDLFGNTLDDANLCAGAATEDTQACNMHACRIEELHLIASDTLSHGGVWLAGGDPLLVSWIGGLAVGDIAFHVRSNKTAPWVQVPAHQLVENKALLNAEGLKLTPAASYQLQITIETDAGPLTDVSEVFSVQNSEQKIWQCDKSGQCDASPGEGVDYCSPDPCAPNGVCRTEAGDFQCKCKDGFAGRTCDTETVKYTCPVGSTLSADPDRSGMCECDETTGCASTEANADCIAVHHAEKKIWQWVFPEMCDTCTCSRNIGSTNACQPTDCGGESNAMQCVNNVCECNYGYRRYSATNVLGGCVWDIACARQPDKDECDSFSNAEWKRGEVATITWKATGSATLKIELVSSSGGSIIALLAKQAPNTGTFNWTVPESIPVNDYTLTLSATYDRRAATSSTVSVAYRDAEYHPGPIISPPKYEIVRATDEARVQWRPPAVGEDDSGIWPMTLVLVSTRNSSLEAVVVSTLHNSSSGVAVGSILTALPDLPGAHATASTPVKLVFRSPSGVKLTEGPVFLLAPGPPRLNLVAATVLDDQISTTKRLLLEWTSSGIGAADITVKVMGKNGTVLYRTDVENNGACDLKLLPHDWEHQWGKVMMTSISHTAAWSIITESESISIVEAGEEPEESKSKRTATIVPICLAVLVIGVGIFLMWHKKHKESIAMDHISCPEAPPHVDELELDDVGAASSEEEEPSDHLEVLTSEVSVDAIKKCTRMTSTGPCPNVAADGTARCKTHICGFGGCLFSKSSNATFCPTHTEIDVRLAAEAEAAARIAAIHARPAPRRLNQADREKLFAIFSKLDHDGDTKLSAEELKSALVEPELQEFFDTYQINDEEELLRNLDADNSGGASVIEFINGMVRVIKEHAEAADAAVANALEAATSTFSSQKAAGAGDDSAAADSDSYDSEIDV
jgi:hypothetical protein